MNILSLVVALALVIWAGKRTANYRRTSHGNTTPGHRPNSKPFLQDDEHADIVDGKIVVKKLN
jgi:hypothetical protein